MKNIIIDLDGTITIDDKVPYSEKRVNASILDQLVNYRRLGFKITIFTSRNMRTYKGNIGEINIHTLPVIIEWLDSNNVPYDEIVVGKPWCGYEGFYVDDKAIRPSEFANLTYDEIQSLLHKENPYQDGGNA